ncbi:MAG: hypothetical protein R2798_06680 [Chitinophagales bacterium]
MNPVGDVGEYSKIVGKDNVSGINEAQIFTIMESATSVDDVINALLSDPTYNSSAINILYQAYK